MNCKNEKGKFHHSHNVLIKGRIMEPVTLENVFEGVYSLFQIFSIRSVHDSLQEEVFLKFAYFAELRNKWSTGGSSHQELF